MTKSELVGASLRRLLQVQQVSVLFWMEILLPFLGCAKICASTMKTISIGITFGMLCCLPGSLIKATAQAANQLTPVPIQSVTIDDSFWSPKRKVWQEVTIVDCFDKFENDRKRLGKQGITR